MKKQATFQITIPTPCHEKWEEMTAVERGRFCAVCQTKVIDFTNDSDDEIIKYLQENNKVCGRLLPEQENRALIEKRKTSVFAPIYKKIAASFILIAAFGDKSFAQQKKQSITQQQVLPYKKPKALVIISGHLLDFETQKPIPNRTIFLKNEGFELQSKTNKWGGFTFSVPTNQQKGIGILNIDIIGTNYIVVDEEISLEKVAENLKLFCYSQAELLRPISKIVVYEKPQITKIGVIVTEKIESTPVHNIISRKTFWQRITHPFKKKKKH